MVDPEDLKWASIGRRGEQPGSGGDTGRQCCERAGGPRRTAEPETTTPPIRYFKEAPHGSKVHPAAAHVRRRPET